eukprot:4039113-Alexandrium_andersonii.AAC.1
MGRAALAWQCMDHDAVSRGFVHAGLANRLDGSEDDLLGFEVKELWEELDMPRERELARAAVQHHVAAGLVRSPADYRCVVTEYEDHPPLTEGEEALSWEPVEDEDLEPDDDGTGDEAELEGGAEECQAVTAEAPATPQGEGAVAAVAAAPAD